MASTLIGCCSPSQTIGNCDTRKGTNNGIQTRQSAFSILYAAIHDYRPGILKAYPRRPLQTYTDWCELCVIMEALEQEEDWWPVEINVAMQVFDVFQLTDACDCDE